MTYNGIKLYMTTEEIIKMYQEAKNPGKQVTILAHMNLCPVKVIKEITGHTRKLSMEYKPLKMPQGVCHETALKLYNAGYNDTEIAKEMGVYKGKIRMWRLYCGLKTVYKYNRKMDEAEALRLYDLGYTDAEIAKELEVAVCTVYKWRLEEWLEINHDGRQRKAG